MPVFEDPNNQALLAKPQELGSINLWGGNNTIGAHSMQLAGGVWAWHRCQELGAAGNRPGQGACG
ncbi:hypothetical protein HaLaN_30832 [Haematococcus lacustris]|uniref:Uncharacterized protein n=1 Tax=Haematococcus lacustris TaxID=44745 RepID=A0A6A0AGK2_HAELA|nr:hypothetical protein HaLaN_30832 [Haematococcus lacustris]